MVLQGCVHAASRIRGTICARSGAAQLPSTPEHAEVAERQYADDEADGKADAFVSECVVEAGVTRRVEEEEREDAEEGGEKEGQKARREADKQAGEEAEIANGNAEEVASAEAAWTSSAA